jgi:hypothetical protein
MLPTVLAGRHFLLRALQRRSTCRLGAVNLVWLRHIHHAGCARAGMFHPASCFGSFRKFDSQHCKWLAGVTAPGDEIEFAAGYTVVQGDIDNP